jgi:hypothetical protein
MSKYVTSDLHGCYDKFIRLLDKIEFNNLSELMNVNSYAYKNYKQFLAELSKKVKFNCDIDANTWKLINK